MQFQTITYKRSRNLPNKESESLEASVLVELGEDPAIAALQLRELVEKQLALPETVQELKNDQIHLEHEIARLEHQIKSATERWDKIRQFMDKLGVKLESQADHPDIPF